MATIRDVAKKAGVSSSTVSRVLSGYSAVSKEKQEMVIKAVNELNYVPNTRGRPSRQARSRTLLILSYAAPSIIIRGIDGFANRHGYDTMVMLTAPGASKSYMKYVDDGVISGVILLNIRMEREELAAIMEKCPVVQCNEYVTAPEVSLVSFDNMGAAREVTEHVIATGKKRPSFITGQNEPERPAKFLQDQEYGFRLALDQAGLLVTQNSIIKINSVEKNDGNERLHEDLMEEVTRLLRLPKSERPDAFICTRDDLAMCCMKAAAGMGIKIPDEVAVTSFNNSHICLLSTPTITSIAEPSYDMGYESAKLLVDSIESGYTIEKRVFLKHRLIVREST